MSSVPTTTKVTIIFLLFTVFPPPVPPLSPLRHHHHRTPSPLLWHVHAFMHLHLLDPTVYPDALCLDGSPGGFYLRPSSSSEDDDNWMIHIQGGGWCYTEQECLQRSFSTLGSSFNWSQIVTKSAVTGPMDEDPIVNPDFARWNHVMLAYCDGSSFTSYRSAPLLVAPARIDLNNTNYQCSSVKSTPHRLWFRGRSIFEAIFLELSVHHNFSSARNVILSGCSAGGLATYLHADYVGQSMLPDTVFKYRAMPISGFFPLINNVDDFPLAQEIFESAFVLHNSSGAMSSKCLNRQVSHEQWKCMTARENYIDMDTAIFPLESAYDSWPLGCLFLSQSFDCHPVSWWSDLCLNGKECTKRQLDALDIYWKTIVAQWNSTETLYKPGNGIFLASCYAHCGQLKDGWSRWTTTDGKTVQQAVSKWWHSDGKDDASDHNYFPCEWHKLMNDCNPSCETLLHQNI